MNFRYLSPTLLILSIGMMALGQTDLEVNHAKFNALKLAQDKLSGPKPMILRGDWWKGRLEPGKAKLVQQHLFKGNTYQFWFALDQPGLKVRVNLYDRNGKLMKLEPVELKRGDHFASIIIEPPATGLYFLRLALSKDESRGSDWALIYAYRP